MEERGRRESIRDMPCDKDERKPYAKECGLYLEAEQRFYFCGYGVEISLSKCSD